MLVVPDVLLLLILYLVGTWSGGFKTELGSYLAYIEGFIMSS